MPNTVQIRGVEKVIAALKKEHLRGILWSNAMYTVGFTQKYALAVHETNKNYKNGKLWKYLETPTRQLNNSGELGAIVRKATVATKRLDVGLKLGALRIQREAMKVVPLDTGALKGSAYVGIGKGEKEAQAAFSKSEAIRARKGSKKK